jgi:hypothetical protein
MDLMPKKTSKGLSAAQQAVIDEYEKILDGFEQAAQKNGVVLPYNEDLLRRTHEENVRRGKRRKALQDRLYIELKIRTDEQWKELSGLPPPILWSDVVDWRKAGKLAGYQGPDFDRAKPETIIDGLIARFEKSPDLTDNETLMSLSKPDTPSRWGIKFGFSAKTFLRRVKSGKIRAKKLSDKSYQVNLDDLPTGQK